MNVILQPPPVGARKIDAHRGDSRGDLNRQWASRPDDQRFNALDELFEACSVRRDNSWEETVEAGDLRLVASRDDVDSLRVTTGGGKTITPTHYSFGQLCQLGRAPAEYLRRKHAFFAALNLQDDLRLARDTPVKIYGDGALATMRAATGPKYGRIFDADVVSAVQKVAGNGTGDTRWKVPGTIDWGSMSYNPYVDVNSETTTLFASDRDVFLFLCDDTHPIEVGKLANGDPDFIFRGFYVSNSEVGARTLKIATMWLRGVCQNRNLWGVEDFDELSIVHSKHGPTRFVREAVPALERYASSEPTRLLAGIRAAKGAIAARTDDERKALLTESLGFSARRALSIIETCEREEGHKPESVWDFCQGITAVARTIPHQDARIDMETTAARLMNRAARNA